MRALADAPTPHRPHLLNRKNCGWGGVKNGELLQLAETQFDLFITADQNIRYQQNLSGRRIAILELSTNDIGRIQSARVLIEETIATMSSDQFKQLTIP